MDRPNTCGIIGICTGWALPIVGITLGIIALCRKENEVMGAVSIMEGISAWIIWMVILAG